MFLDSGDLRNALLTVSKLSEAYQQLNIHLSDDFEMVSARNVLLLYIMLSNGFDPENTDNLDYLWTVWYSLQWTEDTRKRFIKDVEQLLSKNWTINGKVNISELEGVVVLKKMLSSWQDMASCNFVPQKAASILKKTFVSNFL